MKNVADIEKLTGNAKEVLKNSFQLAKKLNSSEVGVEHVFIALLSLDKGLAARFLKSLGVDLSKTIESIEERLSKSSLKTKIMKEVKVSSDVKELLKNAFLIAHEVSHVYVGTEHILLAFLKNKNQDFVKELAAVGLSYKVVKEKLDNYATYPPGALVGKKQIAEKKPEAIDYFGRNLNKLARAGKLMPIIGREKEIDRMIRILSRHSKNNPILIGEAGVGKTAVVEGFVQRIVDKKVPESLQNLEIYQIDIASIIAGSKVRGDVEQRLLVLLSEVSSSPNKILFIDEIHMIVGAGATGPDRSMDIANILKPRLTDGSIRVIGATTNSEYRNYFDDDSALSRRFQPIKVEEITVNDSLKILKGIAPRLEEYHGIKIGKDALIAAAKLSNRYISDRFLPDKAIDVLDEAAALEKLRNEGRHEGKGSMKNMLKDLEAKKDKALAKKQFSEALDYKKKASEVKSSIKKVSQKIKRSVKKGDFKVEEEDIKKVISEWTGIPVTTLSVGEMNALRGIGRKVSRKIVGQKDAVKRVAATLKRSRMGISDERRPLASFLFLGPTGVGKTEMAKVIAKEFLGTEKALIQIDMSEYMEQHSVSKIVGSPPGYVGHQEGGQLTEEVKKRPYSIVLFDEIEKAHPDLLNILLQILEEGHITDSKGRKISFKNTIIILTSNIGARDIGRDKVLGFKVTSRENEKKEAYEKMRERLLEQLRKKLRPEFINRIDEVVIFRGLDEKDAMKIAKILLKEVQLRLKDREVDLELKDDVYKKIAKEGFSEEYGARNIRRKIQELIENPISDLLIEKSEKLEKIKVGLKGKKLTFTTKS
jgi:ATP-dependent Clp protease ATP-binding subunit ClpC